MHYFVLVYNKIPPKYIKGYDYNFTKCKQKIKEYKYFYNLLLCCFVRYLEKIPLQLKISL